MIDPALLGQFGPDFILPIERGHVRQFARAAYAGLPAHLDGSSPIIPATYLVSAGVLWGYTLERPRGTLFEQIDHDLSVPLHAGEAYTFHGPLPRVGEQLTARACLESVKTRQGSRGGELTFLVMLTEFRDANDKLRVEARATTVTTENSPEDSNWDCDPPIYQPDYGHIELPDPFSEIGRQTWHELRVEQGPGAISTGALTLYELVNFQSAGGEMNPLHYDETYARSLGFPGLFGLGMHQASALASYAGRWLGESNVRTFRARFPNIFWVGDQLSYDGKVVQLREVSGHRYVDAELTCTRASDDAVIVQVWMTYDLDQ
jgi:acyl dehydratase